MDGVFRQAHDERHEHIWVRRGICHPCGKTFTIMPDWPGAGGCLLVCCAGSRLVESIAAGDSVEQAAPHCQDPSALARIHPRCADGHIGACSACAVG